MRTNHRGKGSHRRSTNQSNNKTQTNDDDNCSVICYKDIEDGHVGVVRIRQQVKCSVCQITRGTFSSYVKHLLENNHRENVKKACEENRFQPSIYDRAIQLAFQNNFHYQSEKFHFRYKHIHEDVDPSITAMEVQDENAKEKNSRKRRSLQVTLVFQEKHYSRTGTASAQIREQLLQEMLKDRTDDVSSIPLDAYYTKKKLVSDVQKSSVLSSSLVDEVMLKNQQSQHQESLPNGSSSSAAHSSSEENGVEQHSTAMTTDEIFPATSSFDSNESTSLADDLMNVCKEVIDEILRTSSTNSEDFKREQQFLSGIARRSFKKKNTFICDICSTFLTSEKYCIQHLNSKEHWEKISHYQTNFHPWRRAMQQALVVGKTLKEIMNSQVYEEYKTTMALYLAPNSLANRGRFCCPFCELIFPDQWALEKHLHSDGHQNKKNSSNQIDHKELVVNFANVVTLPPIFKFNGVTHLSDIPEDIKTRYQWRCVTRQQLDENINEFLRSYPLDVHEGVTSLVNTKAIRQQPPKPVQNSSRPSRAKRNEGQFNRTRPAQFHTPVAAQRGPPVKRSYPATAPVNKRFRADLNNSFPGVNRNFAPPNNYDGNFYNYPPSGPFNNNSDHWQTRHSVDQHQRQQFFERSNFELRSIATNNNNNNNNGYYPDRPAPPMHNSRNQFYTDQPAPFDNGMRNYNQPSTNYSRPYAKPLLPDYHPEPQNPPLLPMPMHRTNQNNHPPSQPPLMPSMNSNQFGAFAGNLPTSNSNSSYPPSNVNGPPMRPYSDFRNSSNHHPQTVSYPPLPPPSRPFNDHSLSNYTLGPSNSYGRTAAPLLNPPDTQFGAFAAQNSPIRPSTYGTNSVRPRGQYPPSNKPIGPTFSSNSHSNNSNARGRGTSRNFFNRS